MKIIGHRGCRGVLPENTIIAFKEAIKMGVYAIELDVVLSGDGKIVVSHEPFMSRVTCLKPCGNEITAEEDKAFNLFKMPYAEIKTFDCGKKGNDKFPSQQSLEAYKPLLSEVIKECEHYAKSLNTTVTYIIEIKSQPKWYGQFYPQPPSYVQILLKELQEFSLGTRVVLKSFDVAVLNEIKCQKPNQRISLLVNKDELIDAKLKQLEYRPEILGPYFKLLDCANVKKYQALGYELLPWTVNDSSDMNRLLSYGVDGIITDYPNKLKALIQ
ncbi:MAG: glycerophosphodiester phosphodiesterase family protein [Flavobacteriaceae bacterium]